MKLKTSIRDTVDYLKSDEDIKFYWEAIVEDVMDDPDLFLAALGDIARATKNISQLGRDLNVSRESLYKGFKEDGNPAFMTVVKLMVALDLNFTGSQLNISNDRYTPSESTLIEIKSPKNLMKSPSPWLLHMSTPESETAWVEAVA